MSETEETLPRATVQKIIKGEFRSRFESRRVQYFTLDRDRNSYEPGEQPIHEGIVMREGDGRRAQFGLSR